jgi:hypothetical protein
VSRTLVLVALALIVGQLEAAPVPKGGPKPPWKFPARLGTKWVYAESGDRDIEATEVITRVEELERSRYIDIRYECEWVKDGVTWGVIHVTTLWVSGEGLFEIREKKAELHLLRLPYSVGDAWERKHSRPWLTRTASQVVAEEKVKVPAGMFDCVRVETKGYKRDELAWVRTDWYASGIGLVKSTGYPNEKCTRVLKQFTLGKD